MLLVAALFMSGCSLLTYQGGQTQTADCKCDPCKCVDCKCVACKCEKCECVDCKCGK